MAQTRRKIRYGVVGLGYISQVAVLPAFKNADRNSELVALISDDPVKMEELSERYDVPGTCSYEEYEKYLDSGDLDAVYIALPNHLHHEYAMRTIHAGVHVLCEKPMAVTTNECEQMIAAAEKEYVKLMISYRLHFEKANLRAVEIAKSGKLGKIRYFNSIFSMQVKEGNIRLNEPSLGGGPLFDIGIYCINASRYLFQAEPEEVFAYQTATNDPRFQNSEEMLSAVLRFPDERLANFTVSNGAADASRFELVGTDGILRVDPAYEFADGLTHYLTVSGKTEKKKFKKRDQFAPVIQYFSQCILNDEEPEPSGWEGLADVRVIHALHTSALTGSPVALEPFVKKQRPSMEQEIEKPAHPEPELVHAESPSE